MRTIPSELLPRAALMGALCVSAIGLASCSDDTEPPPPPPDCGPNDVACCTVDRPDCMCQFSINCAAGYICNKPSDDLYVSDKPENVCVKVVCAGDNECTAPKKCSLERICEAPLCQSNNDCAGGNVCLGGACEPAPNASSVSSCTVVTTSGAIRQGATRELTAVAKNSNGVVLPGIRFTWMSSNPTAVSVDGNVATGGATSGQATVTAKVTGNESVTCDRNVTLNNFANLMPGQARVVLVADDNGAPVEGAEVTLIAGGNPTTQTTGTDGSAMFAVAGMIESVTAVKAGYQYVSVLSAPADTFIPMPRIANKTMAGGFRGSVDIATARRGDVKLGIAGPSLPSNLLDFEFESLIGDFIPTTIDAPELGIDNDTYDLPGGLVFALGSKKFTDDSATANMRCQSDPPSENELGCYVARAPSGPRAAWTLAGRLTLSAVSMIAGSLAGVFGGDGEDIDVGGILTKVLPLLRTLNHGVNAGLVINEFPKVNKPGQAGNCADPNLADYDDKCQGDFSKYDPIALAADHPLAIDSVVTVPNLPRQANNSYADGIVVLPIAISEGRGLIPLGITAGLDVIDNEAEDGKVAGIEKPFGENSAALSDGEVPLTMAPPHSGTEGSKLALVAIALDPDSITGDAGLQFSGIVKFVPRIEATMSFAGTSFLGFPKGTVDVAAGRFTPAEAVAGAGVLRVELSRDDKTWLIYAPSGSAPVSFPNVMRARMEILGANMTAFLQAVRSPTSYADVFTFGSGKNLDRAVEQIEGFTVQECVTTAGSPCVIQ
jgi:hypothetical protein